MIGDFNAGNYKKDKNDSGIVSNRQSYLLLSEGYLDACQGLNTTSYDTQIDHILIMNDADKSYKYDNVKVDYTMKVSDHYPVYCDILIDSKA